MMAFDLVYISSFDFVAEKPENFVFSSCLLIEEELAVFSQKNCVYYTLALSPAIFAYFEFFGLKMLSIKD